MISSGIDSQPSKQMCHDEHYSTHGEPEKRYQVSVELLNARPVGNLSTGTVD
jgi:hypothetical protein